MLWSLKYLTMSRAVSQDILADVARKNNAHVGGRQEGDRSVWMRIYSVNRGNRLLVVSKILWSEAVGLYEARQALHRRARFASYLSSLAVARA